MNNILLTKYSVKGIKNLENEVSLSFYKKSFSGEVSSKGYNVKAIYGENGAGKTGLVSSALILRSVLVNSGFLNNIQIQSKLGELVNKKTRLLEYNVEFLANSKKSKKVYQYHLVIKRDPGQDFEIEREQLSYRPAGSHSDKGRVVFDTFNGELLTINADENLSASIRAKSVNLLQTVSLAAIYVKNGIHPQDAGLTEANYQKDILWLAFFGRSMHVYFAKDDVLPNDIIDRVSSLQDLETLEILNRMLLDDVSDPIISMLIPDTMRVPIDFYSHFVKQVNALVGFIKLFRNQLVDIEINRQEDGEYYRCNLVMRYDDYSVDAKFESTGIKKLIRLFSYFQMMADGEIVFIDELDSNLHDVYLCALLEYLMEYGKGQLCFTTHNIGPMDVLKRNKKSIEFLSVNQHIYSWTTNGNYSPSKLYREGMISGSPFNIDFIDFIGVFDDPAGK